LEERCSEFCHFLAQGIVIMQLGYQARWVSKGRRDLLKRRGGLGQAVLLDSSSGFLIVEPVGSNLGDGTLLSRADADFELRDVWCLESRKKIAVARQRLGLELTEAAPHAVLQAAGS
jgi:hypothetical protein